MKIRQLSAAALCALTVLAGVTFTGTTSASAAPAPRVDVYTTANCGGTPSASYGKSRPYYQDMPNKGNGIRSYKVYPNTRVVIINSTAGPELTNPTNAKAPVCHSAAGTVSFLDVQVYNPSIIKSATVYGASSNCTGTPVATVKDGQNKTFAADVRSVRITSDTGIVVSNSQGKYLRIHHLSGTTSTCYGLRPGTRRIEVTGYSRADYVDGYNTANSTWR